MSDKGVDSLVNQNNTPRAAVLFFLHTQLAFSLYIEAKDMLDFHASFLSHLKAHKVKYQILLCNAMQRAYLGRPGRQVFQQIYAISLVIPISI